MKLKLNLFNRLVLCLANVLLVFSLASPSVLAQSLPSDDTNSIYDNTVWYKPGAGYGGPVTGCSGNGSLTTLSGNDNIQKVFNYLTGQGLPAASAAGIIGNMEQESGQGIHPEAEQTPGSWEDMSNDSGHAVGIVQWDGSRRPTMIKTLESGGLSLQDLKTPSDKNLSSQLGYFWNELTNNYPGTYSQMKSETDVTQATTDFMIGYEGPGAPQLNNRISYAKEAYNLYSGATSTTGSGSSNCVVSVSCNRSNSSPASNSSLSSVRQNVVCIAQQELALWESQAGYPHPSYSSTGLLKYTDGWYEEWCADFVSWIYNQAGYPFSGGDSGGWRLAGVPEIQALGQQESGFHWHPQSSNYTPKPGDIAIHGTNHVNIYISTTGGTSEYIGGDQGDGPYGAPSPTQTPPSPPSGSIVSIESGSGYYDNGITGYVSPD